MNAIDFELLNIPSELPARHGTNNIPLAGEKPLPTGTDPYSRSVVSVYCRGFHNFAPPITLDWQVMAQFVRLCEEIAEYTESAQWEPRGDKTKSEIADVLIVLSQLAWLTGMSPEWIKYHPMPDNPIAEEQTGKQNIMIKLGYLSRALRKCKGDSDKTGVMAIHAALRNLARQMHIRCANSGFCDIEAEIERKCKADEERGILHGA